MATIDSAEFLIGGKCGKMPVRDAISIANDSDLGRGGSVSTPDLERDEKVAPEC